MRFSVWLKVSRPGLWTTAIWFYLLPAGGMDVFQNPDFYIGLTYVTLPLGMFIYGWNDITDYATDQINPRKDSFLFGARLSDLERAKLPLPILAVQLPFFLYFLSVEGPKIVALFAVAAVAVTLNNWPRFGFKQWPLLDLLIQSSYLLVFVLSSWLNDAPQLPWQTFVFGAAFAMHSHLFGAVMDIEPDALAGRKTTAVVLGRVRSKLLIGVALIAEAFWVHIWFGEMVVAMVLGIGAIWFFTDATLLLKERPYPAWYAAFLLVCWNIAAVTSAPWVWYTAAFAEVG